MKLSKSLKTWPYSFECYFERYKALLWQKQIEFKTKRFFSPWPRIYQVNIDDLRWQNQLFIYLQ